MKTRFKQSQHKKEERIYAYYAKLINQPGAMKTACEEETMNKFKIHSRGTVHKICKRVEARKKQPVT